MLTVENWILIGQLMDFIYVDLPINVFNLVHPFLSYRGEVNSNLTISHEPGNENE